MLSCHGIVEIMKSRKGNLVAWYFPYIPGGGETHDSIVDPCRALLLFVEAEGETQRLALHVSDLLADDWVVLPIDEEIFLCLILQNPEFCGCVILHLVVVAVEMVGGYVENHGYIGLELIHVLKLEA